MQLEWEILSLGDPCPPSLLYQQEKRSNFPLLSLCTKNGRKQRMIGKEKKSIIVIGWNRNYFCYKKGTIYSVMERE
jgi:hypothetical protein